MKANLHWDNLNKKTFVSWINDCKYCLQRSFSAIISHSIGRLLVHQFECFVIAIIKSTFSVIKQAQKSWRSPLSSYALTRDPESDVESDEDLNNDSEGEGILDEEDLF